MSQIVRPLRSKVLIIAVAMLLVLADGLATTEAIVRHQSSTHAIADKENIFFSSESSQLKAVRHVVEAKYPGNVRNVLSTSGGVLAITQYGAVTLDPDSLEERWSYFLPHQTIAAAATPLTELS